MRIAAVIPTLDEEIALRTTLPRLLQLLEGPGQGAIDQIVLVDGGSKDHTLRIAEAAGVRVVHAPRGRGPQLNAGAAASEAEILWFLHADSVPPAQGAAKIRQALAGGAVGGAFVLRFDGQARLYRLGEWVVARRSRRHGMALGDQGQFVRRDAFDAIGGFPDWPILEDLEFIRRLRRHGRLAILEPPMLTSARRYRQGGLVRTTARNWLIFALYHLGVPVASLARLYHHIR